MIRANFSAYGSYVTDSLYQWDINQDLAISGLNLTEAPEIHFTNVNMERAIVRQSTLEDGVVTVRIPNSLLQVSYTIKAYVGVYEGETFKVVEIIEIPIIAKPKPYDYTVEGDEEIYSFKALENFVQNTVDSLNREYEEVFETVGRICDEKTEALEKKVMNATYLLDLGITPDEDCSLEIGKRYRIKNTTATSNWGISIKLGGTGVRSDGLTGKLTWIIDLPEWNKYNDGIEFKLWDCYVANGNVTFVYEIGGELIVLSTTISAVSVLETTITISGATHIYQINEDAKVVSDKILFPNIEASVSVGGLHQVQDQETGVTEGYFNFTGKNPRATAFDPTLTGEIPYGATGPYAVSFGGKGASMGKRAFQANTTCIAKAPYSTALGDNCVTLAPDSRSGGYQSVTGPDAKGSSAEGNGVVSVYPGEHVSGSFNEIEPVNPFYNIDWRDPNRTEYHDETEAIDIIGTGSSDDNRRNAVVVFKSGNMLVNGNIAFKYQTLDGTVYKISLVRILEELIDRGYVTVGKGVKDTDVNL